MKTSELIVHLQKALKEFGDLQATVEIYAEGHKLRGAYLKVYRTSGIGEENDMEIAICGKLRQKER